MAHIETEIALLVVAVRSHAVADEVAALQRIGEYRLEVLEEQRIHDTYFDFPDRRLATADVSLRRRRQEGQELVTLKGPAERLPGGGKRRPELEAPWSRDSAAAVWQALRESDVLVGEEPDADTDLGTALRAEGLAAIQERFTERRRRAVAAPDSPTVPLAELDIDRVVYRFSSIELRIDEVEIEVAPDASPAAMNEIARELLEAAGGALRVWPHSKLATGEGLAAMFAAEELDGKIAPSGYLDAAVFDALDRRLSGGTSRG